MYTLSLIFEQFKCTKELFFINPYTSTLIKTLEISWKHKIQTMIHKKGILKVEDFYLQYYLVNNVTLKPPLVPQNKFACFKDHHLIFNVVGQTFEFLFPSFFSLPSTKKSLYLIIEDVMISMILEDLTISFPKSLPCGAPNCTS